MGAFMTGKQLCRIFDAANLWKNYSRSMRKRRPGSELPHNAFGRYVRRRAAGFVHNGSVILGFFRDDAFFASHFCPAGQRSGMEALKNLRARRDVKVVFAVTEDLAAMLQRLGYRRMGTVPQWFRGEMCEKILLVN